MFLYFITSGTEWLHDFIKPLNNTEQYSPCAFPNSAQIEIFFYLSLFSFLRLLIFYRCRNIRSILRNNKCQPIFTLNHRSVSNLIPNKWTYNSRRSLRRNWETHPFVWCVPTAVMRLWLRRPTSARSFNMPLSSSCALRAFAWSVHVCHTASILWATLVTNALIATRIWDRANKNKVTGWTNLPGARKYNKSSGSMVWRIVYRLASEVCVQNSEKCDLPPPLSFICCSTHHLVMTILAGT